MAGASRRRAPGSATAAHATARTSGEAAATETTQPASSTAGRRRGAVRAVAAARPTRIASSPSGKSGPRLSAPRAKVAAAQTASAAWPPAATVHPSGVQRAQRGGGGGEADEEDGLDGVVGGGGEGLRLLVQELGPSTPMTACPRRPTATGAALFVVIAEVLGAPLAEDVVRGGTALNLAAVAVATLPLAFRRRAPFVVAALVLGAWAGRALAGPPLEIYPLAIASIVAIYSVAAYGSLRDALLALGLLALTVAIAAEAGTGGDAAPDLVPSLFLAGGVWPVGRVARRRHDTRWRWSAP